MGSCTADVELNHEVLEAWLQELVKPIPACPVKRQRVEAARAVVTKYAERILQAEADEELEVRVHLLSGTELGRVGLTRPMKVADVKTRIAELLGDAETPSKLVLEGTILQDADTVRSCGITWDSILQVIVQPPAYRVDGAGVDEVNGLYFKSSSRMNHAVVFTNKRGIMLFKYVMRRGTHYWYFSDAGDLKTKHGDYYRIRSDGVLPPLTGWTTDDCPRGADTQCPELTALLEDDALLEDATSSDDELSTPRS
mmetsp:Transcript_22406/g.42265  ORF Transcript_22406/g.42265 Transcript_22406/m.42265 type:complete len:254 (+) Transcript_22406:60-821(+)